jgi:predicted homoserine dehydrogenase-like protein
LNDKVDQTDGTSTTSDLESLSQKLGQLEVFDPVSQSKEPEDLLDQVIRYRNDTGEVKECMVVDYCISKLRGDWFVIMPVEHPDSFADLEEISATEMDDILAQQIQL